MTPSIKTSSRFGRAAEAFLREYGFRRVTAAAATATRTFETSDAYDVPIGGRAFDRTLARHKAQNLNKLCWDAYKKNPIIWGMVELVVRATAGKEIKIQHNKLNSENAQEKAVAERIQVFYDRWWNAPENDWPLLAEKIQRDIVLFGEVIPLPITNSLTGDVEMGFIDVNCIKSIIRHQLNARRVLGISVLLDEGKERNLKLVFTHKGQPIDPAEAEWFQTWQNVNSSKLIGRKIGEVFYWANNLTISSLRGQGDFAQVIDPANDAVRIVRGISDRIQLNNRVWSEIVFPDNWTQELVNAAMNPTDPSYINPPRLDDDSEDFKVFGHTAQIQWNLKSPNVAASETVDVFKMSLALVSSGSNIPLHWMGWADELTYASAKEISNIPLQYLRDRQGSLRKCLREATDFQIDQWRIFSNEFAAFPDEMIYNYDFAMPTIDARTIEQIATTMRSEIDAVVAAKMNKGIDEQRAADMIQKALRRGGVDAR